MGKNVAAGYALSNIIKSESYVDDLIREVETKLDNLAKTNQPCHLDNWSAFFAFDVLGEVTFSRAFGFVKSGFDIGNEIANQRRLSIYISTMGHFLWLHNLTLGNPLISTLGLIPASHVFDTCKAAIEVWKKNPEGRNDMMARWLHVRNNHPDRMSDRDVFAAAATM